jgi:hypothetical protein
MKPKHFVRIVDRKRYDTKTATLIASDAWWDGHNFERRGRNTWLYRTPKGAFFTVTQTQWEGERDNLEPVSQDEAVSLFEGALTEHEVAYHEAFPDLVVEDA